jgi:ribosome-binding protein aMBF1 (putative translation factor)
MIDQVGYCDKCGKEVGASKLVNVPGRELMYCKKCMVNKIKKIARKENYYQDAR